MSFLISYGISFCVTDSFTESDPIVVKKTVMDLLVGVPLTMVQLAGKVQWNVSA